MKCRRAKDLIHDFIDGVIGEPDRIGLEQHLGDCTPCEAMATSLSKSLDLLHSLPAESLDDNFTWKVRLRLARARNAAESDAQTQRGWLRAWNTRFALSAAATFVAVVGAGYFVASSFVLPDAGPVQTPLLAKQPLTQTVPSEVARAERPVLGRSRIANPNIPMLVSNFPGVGPTNGGFLDAGGGLLAEEPISRFTNLDSLKAEVYKSRCETTQVKLLLDQVNHLQSELRSCESECGHTKD